MEPIYELQAEILRTLAHPRRLQIVHELAAEPRTVGRLAADLGLAQPNVSQHLALMRGAGVVTAEREGREMRYRVTDPDVITACGLMRRALDRRLALLRDSSINAPTSANPNASTPRNEGITDGPDRLARPLLRHR